MNKLIILFGLFALASASFLKDDVKKANYAVIVAGSNGYWNYRHQADVFHAYHILLKNGMPKENIILFAYDDVANNSNNPFPGQVFNKPSPNAPGEDFYAGVVIDYKGKDVTPQNFLNVLEGNSEAMKGIGSGRVLNSTKNDHVFINFADHGATGLIAFPSGELYADQLIKTFKKMNEQKMYKQLVFYLEACESGSMFNKVLPDNINIYASSAANPYESSWGCYCGTEAKVNGKNINSCLGDLYSVVWMEDSDLSTKEETIEGQFAVIQKKVDKSSPMEWGDRTFEKEAITDFQGTTDSTTKNVFTDLKELAQKYITGYSHKSTESIYLDLAKKSSALDSRDIKLHYLYDMVSTKNDLASSQELEAELRHREVVDVIFKNVALKLELQVNGEKNENIQFECLRNSVNHYKQSCSNFSEYTLKYVQYLSVACKQYTEEKVKEVISEVCEN